MSMSNKTKLVLSNDHGEVSIEANNTGLNIQEMFELLIIPLLLAATYPQSVIDGYLDNDN